MVDKSSILDRFAAIEVGALRADVEEVLGRPVIEGPERLDSEQHESRLRAWYMEGPDLPGLVAPAMPGAIEVIYVRERVVEKKLNPQIRL